MTTDTTAEKVRSRKIEPKEWLDDSGLRAYNTGLEEAARLIEGTDPASPEQEPDLREWMLARLEELRANPSEDAVLDLMDRLTGWSSPHLLPPSNTSNRAATPVAGSTIPPLDVARLSEAMNESYWPDDLPFVDDGVGFWDPFAAKVLARLAESPVTGEGQ